MKEQNDDEARAEREKGGGGISAYAVSKRRFKFPCCIVMKVRRKQAYIFFRAPARFP